MAINQRLLKSITCREADTDVSQERKFIMDSEQKHEIYDLLVRQAESLTEDERLPIPNLANTAAMMILAGPSLMRMQAGCGSMGIRIVSS